MARTAEQTREYNRVKRAQWRANQKAKKAAASSQKTPGVAAPIAGTVATPGAVEEPELVVDVKAEDTPKQSLKDRILAKLQDPTPAPKRPVARGKKQENLLATTLPTVVCSFVATYSQQLIADPYKPCAPSQAEVTGMLGPLMDILSRQIEITGKASQTTIDIMNSIICTMMYSVRAYITYVEIKKMETPQNYAEEKARKQAEDRTAYRDKLDREAREYEAATADDMASLRAHDDLSRGLRAYQGTAHGLNGNNGGVNAAAANANATESHDVSSGSNTADGTQEGEPSEASLISDMFKRDIDGRIRLGLLAPRV